MLTVCQLIDMLIIGWLYSEFLFLVKIQSLRYSKVLNKILDSVLFIQLSSQYKMSIIQALHILFQYLVLFYMPLVFKGEA